jgi:16S rRNA (cytidine1402-2'-O)-methyltransferase
LYAASFFCQRFILKMGRLFVVGTPIGNLADITARALETLRSVGLIACEDTRHTIKLLNHFGIHTPLESYHEYNEEKKAQQLMTRIRGGLDVALVSDAGTPAISDPGYRLVRMCRENDVAVLVIPGPSAALAALSVSGLPSDEFLFVGFLSAKSSARREKLEALRIVEATLVFYESPHRVVECLKEMLAVFGDRNACIARELTKIHEECRFGKLSDLIDGIKPVGEFVIVVGGGRAETVAPIDLEGLSRKDVLKLLSEKTGIPKRQLYDILLKD